MALLLKKLFRGYFTLFNDMSDPRAEKYFLMSSPLAPLAIVGFYLYFVFNLGPRFMKNRQPYNLEKVLMIFNLSQVFVNAYLLYYCSMECLKLDWYCSTLNYDSTPHNNFILDCVYIYFLTKVIDLLDTVFFVLRKKQSQITFLHVYHHFGMIAVSWVGVKFVGSGQSLYLGLANTMVHSIMYFYYFLTIWKPEYKRSIWWKKHITQLQLAQFVFFIVTYGQLLLKPWCTYPKVASYFMVPQNVFMLILFSDFYYKAYVRPNRRKGSKFS